MLEDKRACLLDIQKTITQIYILLLTKSMFSISFYSDEIIESGM